MAVGVAARMAWWRSTRHRVSVDKPKCTGDGFIVWIAGMVHMARAILGVLQDVLTKTIFEWRGIGTVIRGVLSTYSNSGLASGYIAEASSEELQKILGTPIWLYHASRTR